MLPPARTQDRGEHAQDRTVIFQSALKLFRGKGFDATTMREIAADAGVALGAAYYYFPSKEAIIQAYYELCSSGAQSPGLPMHSVTQKMDLKQRIQFALRSKLDIVQNDRKLLGVVFRYSGEPDHPLSCLGPAGG